MKGLGFGQGGKKKAQIVPVNYSPSDSSWLNVADNEKVPTGEGQGFDVNLLDYMGVEEFVNLMRNKTENDYDSLWSASRSLAMQVKTSKALLSLGSQLCAGKTKTEVLDKLIESMKFSLKADHVFIMEYVAAENSLRVTHSDCISANNHLIPRNIGIEGEVFMNGVLRNEAVDPAAAPSQLDTVLNFKASHVLCAPIIVNNQTYGILKAVRGSIGGSESSPRAGSATAGPFLDQEESMIGFTAANVGFVLKYVVNEADTGRYGRAPGASTPVMGHLPDQATGPAGGAEERHSIDNVVNYLIQNAYKEFGADRISVFKLNRERSTLECVISQDIKGLSVPANSGIMGHCLSVSAVVVTNDVAADKHFNKAVDSESKYTTKNILCAPIVHAKSGETVGVLELLNKSSGAAWNDSDQVRILEVAQRLAVLLQTKEDLDVFNTEKKLTHDLSQAMHHMLTTSSQSEMVAVMKHWMSTMVDADFVELFELDNDGDGVVMRRVRSNPAPKKQGDEPEPPAVSEEALKTVPKEVLECIRSGDLHTFTQKPDGTRELVPGCVPKIATIYPVGSKVFAGSPPRHLVIIARTKSDAALTPAQKSAISLFVEILGSVLFTFERVKQHDMAVLQKNWELNMIIHALKLMHNYVMLLDHDGTVVACNRAMGEVIGEERKLYSPYTKWFTADQMLLKDDIASVYNVGVSVHKDCVLIKGPGGDSINISYQLCPVDMAGRVQGEGEPPMEIGVIRAVIVVIHKHGDDEDGAKRLREVLASKTREAISISGDTSTVHGTMTAVAQAICEIGGRFNLGYAEQSAINNMAASVMQVGRNMRATMATSNNASLMPAMGGAGEDTRPAEALDSLSKSAMTIDPLVLVMDEAKAITDLFTWEFDVNLYSKQVLRGVLGRLFTSMLNLSEIQINPNTLCNFIREAEKHYHDNPFHNFYHICCVTHFSYMLITASGGKKLVGDNTYYLFAIMLSAVVHDIDHPGNSNLFETNSKSELALLYNEQSVLENHHCSMAFRIMRFHNSDVLSDMSPAVYKDVKKTIISCILSTDMSVHFDLIDRVKKKVAVGWNLSDVEDLMFYCRIILHASDLSNPVRVFPLAKLWASRISAEFNRQVELEKKLDLPVLGFMITPDEKTLCKNEIGFASFVVAPMWRNLESLFTGFQPLVKQLNDNLDTWKGMLDDFTKAEEKEKSKK